jgi:Tfx family DNA-binding protein
MSKDSFITKRQLQILELRNTGLSQAEIARRLGTTRANISATEKTARENIKRAKKTVNIAKMLEASLSIKIDRDTDLNEIPGIIYEKAGKEKIWINLDNPSLIGFIAESCKNKIKGRRVIAELEIAITRDGSILAR